MVLCIVLVLVCLLRACVRVLVCACACARACLLVLVRVRVRVLLCVWALELPSWGLAAIIIKIRFEPNIVIFIFVFLIYFLFPQKTIPYIFFNIYVCFSVSELLHITAVYPMWKGWARTNLSRRRITLARWRQRGMNMYPLIANKIFNV